MSEEMSDLVNFLAIHPISLWLHVSGITLLFIDWLSTLDDESAYAWKGRWNWGKILYFVTRYSAFLDVGVVLYRRSLPSIQHSLCTRLDNIMGSLTIFGIVVAELIMTIRVWALWNRSKTLGIVLSILGVINTVASSVAYRHFGPPYQYVVIGAFSTVIPGCFPIITNATKNSWSFIPLIVHQTLIFSLTAMKGTQHYWSGIYGSSLIDTFFRDGISYYALLVAFSIVNLAAIIQESDVANPYFLTFLQRLLHSILSARMLLHLRREFDIQQDSGDLTSLEFAGIGNQSGTLSTSSGEHDIPNGGWFGQGESPWRPE